MKLTRSLAAVAVVGAGAVTALPGLASASTAPAGAWPAQVQGAPAHLAAGSPTGYYLWHTDKGWSLEVTHPGTQRVVFSGTVHANGTVDYTRVGDEKSDITKLGPGHHTLAFAFTNFGRLDGVRFVVPETTTLTFALTVDGRPVSADVHIGSAGLHPDRDPFTVTRTAIH